MTEIIPNLHNKQDLSNDASGLGPGQVLADARQKWGKSIHEIAKALNVSSKTIVLLEQDDFANLPPTTFVRGYLRTFAKEVGVDPVDILNRHTRLTGDDGTGTNTPLRILPSETVSFSLQWLVQLAFWLAVVLLVIGLITFSISFWGEEIVSGAETVFDGESTSFNSSADLSMPTLRGGEFSLPITPPPPMTSPATSPMTSPTITEVEAVQIDIPENPITLPKPNNDAIAQSTLTLRFTEASWIRIVDSQKKNILSGEVGQSQTRTVTGVAPFSVRIGNSGGVAIEHNGQPVNYSPRTSGVVAEFIIGAN